MSVRVLQAGALTTVQDLGRKGYARQGYRECGACDKYAMQLANILAGNPRDAAVLELTLMGGRFLMEADICFALTGADMRPRLDGKDILMYKPVAAKAGQRLELGAAVSGLRCYLAFSGGIDVPEVMGSRSTDLRCGLGGLEGRALRSGDRLVLGEARVPGARLPQSLKRWLAHPGTPLVSLNGKLAPVLRAVPGPQEERFTESARTAFAKNFYIMQADSDRMGARFCGAALEAVQGYDIISDGIVEGSVQVSNNGQPIVMLADHQTTGGYAKIATVISADIPAAAQCRPGEKVCFRYVDPKEAVEAARAQKRRLDWAEQRCRGGSV